MLDVCCVADLCVDLIVTGDVVPRFGQVEQLVEDYAIEPGGSATIFASQFVKLGGSAGLLGGVGRDPFGNALLAGLNRIGIDTKGVRERADLKTGLGLALSKPDGDRAILTYLGTIDSVGPEDLSESRLRGCRHWHLASYFLLNRLRDAWPDWLRRCRDAGLTTSMDTNWDPESRWDGVIDLLPLLDVFLPNDAEAKAIAKEEAVEEAGRRLAAHGPLVVVKRGAEGATAFRGEECWGIRTGDVGSTPPIVDTTGAGDNFDAGFLRGWLRGYDIDRCLHLGTRCAVSSLACAGGIRGQWSEREGSGER